MVDVTGITGVAKLIEQSGLAKFAIYRNGQSSRSSLPVFEWYKGTTAKAAVESFENWGRNVMMGGGNTNEYEIYLFNSEDDPEISPDDNKRGWKKKNKMTFTFQLSPSGSAVNGYERTGDTKNVSELVEMAVANAMAQRDKDDLRKEIAELREEIREMEEDDTDDDQSGNQTLNGLAALIAPYIKGTKQPEALAGTEEAAVGEEKLTQDQIATINRALKVLYKYDKQIDTDLLKLAGIAQNNPTQFQFLLNALRGM